MPDSMITPVSRCMPQCEWPAPDQAAWAASLLPGDPFSPGGVAARWASATVELVINGYGRYLTFLAIRGLLDPAQPPAMRVRRAWLDIYLDELKATNAPYTVATRIEQLGNAMRAMVPEQDWHWIQRAADRLRAKATPVRNKRARLQPLERLLELGDHLMAFADTATDELPAVRATAYRDGLIITLLACRPLRRRNLAAISCAQQLVEQDGAWWLLFGDQTKTSKILEAPVPETLVPCLERYTSVFRPILLARGQQEKHRQAVTALWVSRNGARLGEAAITRQVRDRTRAAFGTALTPHMFRDCVATGVAIESPQDIAIVPTLLNHAGIATSERHYNLAGSLEAGRRYHAVIDDLRTEARHRSDDTDEALKTTPPDPDRDPDCSSSLTPPTSEQ